MSAGTPQFLQPAAARARADEELSFRALAESIPQLVWTTRPDGRIVYANGRFLEYFRIRREALADSWLAPHLHPDDVVRATARWKASLQSGDPYEVEYRLRNADGEFHWFLARGTPYRDRDGEIVGWFGTSTPIDRQQEQIERQRRVVEAFTQAFVPRPIPALDGLAIDGAYFAADEEARVGGDFYDVMEFDDGSVLVAIGDVTGHGLYAALSTAKLRQAIIAAALDERDPARILARADRLFSLVDNAVATAAVGFVDRGARRFRYALAGHPPPVVATPHGARFMRHGGIALGVAPFPDAFVVEDLPLEPDDLLVFYTDGLIEARRSIAIDEALLLDAAQSAAAKRLGAPAIRDAVIGTEHTRDDIAILTLRLTS